MSILDALRLQRTEQNSVRDLAMLPQAKIIQLAQMGQIPAEVVPVIISEKARMAQTAAQMQAAQQQPQPTVIEQAMAQNAQAETPMNGVASIPTQMFQPQSYQTGGIVAFQGGGATDPFFDRIDETPAYTPPGASMGSIDAYIQEAAARRAEARRPTEAMLALERSIADPAKFADARREAQNMALLQAGLGILGGTSPYALQNIGRGAAGAAESYGQNVRSLRQQESDAVKQRALLDLKKQEQALADIASGEASYSAARKEALEGRKLESAEARERTRAEGAERREAMRQEGLASRMTEGRVTDRAQFVADYVSAAQQDSANKGKSVEQLRLEAQNAYNAQEARVGLSETQLRNAIISDIDRQVAERRNNLTAQERQAVRKFVDDKRGTPEDYWRAIRDSLIAARYAELNRSDTPVGTPRAAPSTVRTIDFGSLQQ